MAREISETGGENCGSAKRGTIRNPKRAAFDALMFIIHYLDHANNEKGFELIL